VDSAEDVLIQLYDRWRGPLLHYVLRLVDGDYQQAEDVVQETLLRAWRHYDELNPDDAAPWLYTVARNLVISGYRRRNARATEVPLEPVDLPPVSDKVEHVLHRRGGRQDARHPAGHGQVALLLRTAGAARRSGGKRGDRGVSCQHTVEVGAYLFGSLDLKERSAFEKHLGNCDACQAEMLRLAPLPGLLGRLSLEDVENLDEIPSSPPKPNHHRRVLIACAAVLTVLALAGGLFFLRPAPSPPVPTWVAQDQGTGVNASVSMITKSWGTEMRFKLGNVKPGARCKVMVFSREGQREIGGWWGSDHAADEEIPGSTSFSLDRIDRLEVSDESGPLVTLRP
jgi:RNA polymerase sigma factor (sigma-70 family)